MPRRRSSIPGLFRRRKNGKILPTWWIGRRRGKTWVVRESLATTDRREAARRALPVLAKAGERPEGGPAKAAGRGLTDLSAKWIDGLKADGCSAIHVAERERCISRFLADVNPRSVQELDSARANEWLSGLMHDGRGGSKTTRNKHASAITAFSQWLADNRHVPYHALAAVHLIDASDDRRYVRAPYTPEELARMFALPCLSRAVRYRITYTTGLRKSEIDRLDVEQFDLERAVIRIEKHQAKGRASAALHLTPATVVAIRAYLASRPEITTGPMFPDGRIRDETFELDLAAANVPLMVGKKHHDFHALRGTANTHLDRLNVRPTLRQKFMRHSDLRLTQGDSYLDVPDPEIAAAADLLDALVCTPVCTSDRRNRPSSAG